MVMNRLFEHTNSVSRYLRDNDLVIILPNYLIFIYFDCVQSLTEYAYFILTFQGSLKLFHYDVGRSSFKVLRLNGGRYSNLRKLRNRTVYDSAIDGSCCWNVNRKSRFRGENKYLDHSDQTVGFTPKAAKRVHCA